MIFFRCGKFAALLMLLGISTAFAEIQRFERGEFHFESGPPASFVERVPVMPEWPADAPGAEGATWRNWLIDFQADFRGAEPEHFHEHVIEATSETLLTNAARFEINFNPAFQFLRIHAVEVRRGGSWSDRFDPTSITLARREGAFENDMSDGRVSALIVVADVRPGDLVRYAYSLRGSNPVLGNLIHNVAYLRWIEPILQREVRMLYPPDADVDMRIIGEAPSAEVRRLSDALVLRWSGRGQPASPMEEDAPTWHFQQPVLEVAARRSWADVARWAGELYPKQESLPRELEDLIEQWRALPEPKERAAAALRSVQDDVRYFSVLMGESTHRPSPPDQTWDRRFGDCKDKAWLLSTLLTRLNIDSEPALVSTLRGRSLDTLVPAASQFDHVIVRARIEDETYWLDPTRLLQRGPLEVRQSHDFGFALPVHSPSEGLVDMDSLRSLRAVQHVHERFLPSPDGQTIRLEVETRLSGAEAERRRQEFRSLALEEISRGYADYYSRLHGELASAQPLRIEDDDASGELTVFEAYELNRPWAVSTAGVRVFEIYADLLAPYLALSGTQQRRQPLWRPHPIELRQTTEIVLPAGWTLAATPNHVDAADKSFRYARRAQREADRIMLNHSFESLAMQVPADQAGPHFEARRRALEAVSIRLQFTLPSSAADGERNRRLRALLGKPVD